MTRTIAAPVSVAAAAGLLLGVSLAASAAVGVLPPERESVAHAASASRWTVVPADASGPDGRHAIEMRLDPGRSVDDHVAVRNESDTEVVFRLTAADGFTSASGRFDVVADGAASVGAGSWITIPDRVSVPSGATVVVPFAVTAPPGAAAGDHSAGITASVVSAGQADGGAQVGVESRVGVRVLARVAGAVAPAASLHGAVGSYEVSWNPLRAGSAIVTFDVVNDGNTRLLATGTVTAAGRAVAFPAEGQRAADLLPGDRRTLRVVVDGVWPSLQVPVEVALRPRAIPIDGDAPLVAATSLSTSLWAAPVAQLVALLGVALLVLAVFWGRWRPRRRTDSLAADARERGRRPATAALTEESTDA